MHATTPVHAPPTLRMLALLAVLAVGLVLLLVRPAAAADVLLVDASGGADTGDCTVTACLTIEYAVSQAEAGDTIDIAPGTYATEQVVIAGDLAIEGEAGVIVVPALNLPGNTAANAWFLVQAGVTASFTGLQFDAAGWSIEQGIRSHGNTTIDGVTFANLRNGVYGGKAVVSYGGYVAGGSGNDSHGNGLNPPPASHLDVTDSTFSNIGRIGILVKGAASTAAITGIDYTGKGAGNHLDYAVEAGASAQISVMDSTISDNRGVASSDGSTSAGILVTTFYGVPGNASEATITGNTFSGNQQSIAVGFGGSDENVVVATDNSFAPTERPVGLTGTLVGLSDISNNTVVVSPGQSVNDALFGAGENGTLEFAPGTHTGGFAINVAGVTLTAANHNATVAGRIDISADNVTVDGLKVTNPTGGYGVVINSVDGATVANSIFMNIGTNPAHISSAQAIYYVGAASGDNPVGLTLTGNTITGVGNQNSAESTKGIFIGDSTANVTLSGVLISGNVISGIRAKSDAIYSGGGRGANGINLNFGSGASGVVEGLVIENNEISDLEGFWVHAIGLETDTPGAIVQNNTIDDLIATKVQTDTIGGGGYAEVVDPTGVAAGWRDEVAVLLEANSFGDSADAVVVTNNAFAAGIEWGVYKRSTAATVDVDANMNWWGSPAGPGGDNPGIGAGAPISITDPAPTDVVANTWQCTGIDISGATGFQPEGAVCPVTTPPGVDPGDLEAVASDTLEDGQELALDVSSGQITASYSGDGFAIILLAEYTANPAGEVTGFNVGDTYLDVYVGAVTDPAATLTLTVPCGDDGDVLRFWNGDAWAQVVGNDGNPAVCSGGSLVVTFGPSSNPTMSGLTGTPIVSGDPSVLEIQIAEGAVTAGDTVTANVVLKATDFQAIDVELQFDETALEVDSIELWPSSPTDAFEAANTFDNVTGDIHIAFALQGPSASGNELIVATITFTALSGGVTGLTVGDTVVSDSDGFAIEPLTINDDDTVTVTAAAGVTGTVTLQGRTNHSGVVVSVYPSPFNPLDSVLASGSTATSGGFSFSYGPGGEVVRFAIAPGYLRASSTITLTPGANSFTPIQLRGGDANGDNQIGLFDLAAIALGYGSAAPAPGDDGSAEPPQALQIDINGDATINIFDLAVTAGNYGATGPSNWP